jgi:hypothetical protein
MEIKLLGRHDSPFFLSLDSLENEVNNNATCCKSTFQTKKMGKDSKKAETSD